MFRHPFIHLVFISFLLLMAAPDIEAARIAIFDYDDRIDETDTVAKYIEQKLSAAIDGVSVDQYSGKGSEQFSIEILRSLDKSGYDLIITITTDALILAHHLLKETPTLYTNVNNPLLLGFTTLDAPGGNISGATYYVPVRKQVELFREIQPGMKTLGFIFDKNNKSTRVEIGESRWTCKALNITFCFEFIETNSELDRAAVNLIKNGCDALVVTTSDVIYNNLDLLIKESDKAKIPVYSFHKNAIEQGAIACLASDYYIMADELVVPMAVKVIRDGVSPGDMPAAFLNESYIYLNATHAARIGVQIPERIQRKAFRIY